jgi:hypothetical protein
MLTERLVQQWKRAAASQIDDDAWMLVILEDKLHMSPCVALGTH